MNHETSQDVTNLKKMNAIDLLIQGLNDREVADKIGTSRETVTRWRNENPVFQAELNRRRQEIWGGACEKLRGLVSHAVDVLESELENGNSKLKAAVEILKATGLYGNVPSPDGETNPDAILKKQAEDWARNEMKKLPTSGDGLTDLLKKDEVFAQLVKEKMAGKEVSS